MAACGLFVLCSSLFSTAYGIGRCTGDFTGDGVVNFTDLGVLLDEWGTCLNCAADTDGNGKVNFTDLAAMKEAAFNVCDPSQTLAPDSRCELLPVTGHADLPPLWMFTYPNGREWRLKAPPGEITVTQTTDLTNYRVATCKTIAGHPVGDWHPNTPQTESVVELASPAADYCNSLPTGTGKADLKGVAAGFSGALCGKYQVSCPNVDDATMFVLIVGSGTSGTILSIAGERSDYFHTENVSDYASAGFRVVMPAFEETVGGSALCARSGCPLYVATDDPGPREASCRVAALARYLKAQAPSLPLCAQGHSSGSSALAYALAWQGLADVVPYVQLTAFTPLGSPDAGCNPTGPTTVGWSGTNPDGTPQTVTGRPYAYTGTAGFAHTLVEDDYGIKDNRCGAGTTSANDNIRLAAQAIAATGAVLTYPTTIIDGFACLSSSSITDGNGAVAWLPAVQGANAGRVFVQGLAPGTQTNKACTGEQVWRKANNADSVLKPITIARMISECH